MIAPEIFLEFRIPSKIIIQFLSSKFNKQDKIIDLGCGPSACISNFSNIIFEEMLGLDNQSQIIKTNKSPIAEYIIGDIEMLPIKTNFFDKALLTLVYHQLNNKNKAFKEIHRILKQEGTLFIVTHSQEQLEKRILLKHFPSLLQIELERFATIKEIEDKLSDFNFTQITRYNLKEPLALSTNFLLGYAKNKACSSLHIYEDLYGKDRFLEGFNKFKQNIESAYGINEIITEESGYTIITAKKAI